MNNDINNTNNNSNSSSNGVKHLGNVDPQFVEKLYNLFDSTIDKMTNSEYINAMTRYGGYLSYQQRLELNKKYAKIDGDRQIKNHENILKAQEEYYEKHIKPQIDPNLPLNSSYNLMVAQKASEEDAALQKLAESFKIAKEEARKHQVYQINESNNPKDNFLNVRHKNVIVQYRDGTISHYNEEEDKKRMEKYKQELQKNHQSEGFKPVEEDSEYS